MKIGIEAINIFGGTVYIDVEDLAKHRNLDTRRFENLLMKEKAVALPFEDPVSFALNAAKPIVDKLSSEDKNKIELLITCTESGIDFGKSLSTYVHEQLELSRNCRMFEIKQACYSGTAGLQMAINFIRSQTSPGAKALIIATDISRFLVEEGNESAHQDWSFAEPSSGAGAVAMIISEKPEIFQIDIDANGFYGYQVMDTCRPSPDSEAGNSDLSLMSYLDCFEQSFQAYKRKVNNADFGSTFHYMAYHTPFGGMIKGAHRTMMRKHGNIRKEEIEKDFDHRVLPGLNFCQRVGNIMGATLYLSLVSTIVNAQIDSPKRIGCFSYGSGCCSEFFSGVVTSKGQQKLREMNIKEKLDNRYKLNIEEYETLLAGNGSVRFGTRNVRTNEEMIPELMNSKAILSNVYLKEIKEFYRQYGQN